jgi:NAD(P)-dependent dehydrogenase (short-subunit alcohol dehydrogenase family)
MAKEFDGKIALVTGGSRGIGRAIAAAFAREGAETVLVASSATNLAAAADAIAKSGAKTPLTVQADLRQPDQCERVFTTVRDKLGRLDILVNNAGATRAGNFTDLSEEMWQDGFALKFFGCVRLCRHFWPMLKASQGHVISVIGGAARTPDPGFLIGGSVNAAMHNFTKGLSALGRARWRQRQRHPARHYRDRARRAALQAARRGRGHHAGPDPRRDGEEGRAEAPGIARGLGRAGAVLVLRARPPHPGHGHRGRRRLDLGRVLESRQ